MNVDILFPSTQSPRSLGLCCVKESEEPTSPVDSSVPFLSLASNANPGLASPRFLSFYFSAEKMNFKLLITNDAT